MNLIRSLCAAAALLVLAAPAAAQEQKADPDFRPTVARPAFEGQGPVVAIDEAHQNFHTADGRYAPFAELLKADGFRVRPSTAPFTAAALQGVKVLVIANAGHAHGQETPTIPEAEAAALAEWVRAGGSLLLIADHAPFGEVAEPVGAKFGVAMGKGWAFAPTPDGKSIGTQFVFSRENGRLGDHAILRGRDPAEAVRTVRAFTGQSLSVPPGAANLLRLDPATREAKDTDALNAAAKAAAEGKVPVSNPPAGLSQGLAMTFGKGRVVILGEAALFSAQVVTLPEPEGLRTFRVGMNVAGYDNQQFALNVVRWLAGALD